MVVVVVVEKEDDDLLSFHHYCHHHYYYYYKESEVNITVFCQEGFTWVICGHLGPTLGLQIRHELIYSTPLSVVEISKI